mgnify:CR=1 FL=1
MKTVIDIKDDVYNVIKGSALDEEATGKLCKSSKRPANSDKEDIVISVIGNNVSHAGSLCLRQHLRERQYP